MSVPAPAPSTAYGRARSTRLRVTGSLPGPESTLPAFTPLRALSPVEVGPDAPAGMAERVAYGRLGSPLPYALQSDYARHDERVELPALELANGLMTATVLPTLGGRVWSLYDEARGRELLHVNPVLRFANFGLTDAWFAGGIEWNLGSTGHTSLSSRPMHAAVLPGAAGECGDVIRLWEWERTRDLVLQVDLWLRGDRLLASTRVVNPDPEPKPLYYWTNIAVPETSETRVLCPATHAWRTDYSGELRRVDVPHPDLTAVDISRPGASAMAADYFFEVAEQESRVIVAVESDGRGFAQTSTAALTGRKLFLWGSGPGGARWQEWLSGLDSAYAEIQAGVLPTQLEHTPLAGRAEVSWTEAFGAVDLAPSDVAGEYAAASGRAAAAVRIPELEDVHDHWRGEIADLSVDALVCTGSGWGHAELGLRGLDACPGAPALTFPEVDDASAVALAVLRGTSLDAGADRMPVPPVSDLWFDLLRQAPAHWWRDLALAVNHQLRGDLAAARAGYKASLAARPSAVAERGLALLADDVDSAVAHYARARSLDPDSRGLATEQLTLLICCGRPDHALQVIETLPDAVRRHGRTRLLEAVALTDADRADEARLIMDDVEVPDLAEGGLDLGDLWVRLHPDLPLPQRLDFRMHDDGARP